MDGWRVIVLRDHWLSISSGTRRSEIREDMKRKTCDSGSQLVVSE